MKFYKYEALGNDFVLVDTRRRGPLELTPGRVRVVCARHTGIGADGILVLSDDPTAAAKMSIYNADGSEAQMCGNGLRCVADFLLREGIQNQTLVRVGPSEHIVRAQGINKFSVQLGAVQPILPEVVRTDVGGRILDADLIRVGNPHAVLCVPSEDVQGFAKAHGASLSTELWQGGTLNVSFVYPEGGRLIAAVYERGVGLTQACGSGACAIAYVAKRRGLVQGDPVSVHLPGGTLEVSFDESGRAWLTGPARQVFWGEWAF